MTPDLAAALQAAPPARLVDVAGGPLAVVDVAADPDAPPLGTAVLVHGYTGSKEDFLPLLAPLAAAGLRVVAYDQRGQHASPGPDDPGAYGVEALAGDLLGLLDALGTGPVHLLGHSFGGLVVRAAALRRPAAVRSLVLLASGPHGAGIAPERVARMEGLTPVFEAEGLPGVWAGMERLAAADPRAAAQPAAWRAMLRDRFLAGVPTALPATGEALLAEPDRTAALAALGLPVLVLHGDADDAWSPALQAEMARRLGADHVVLPGVVHSPALEEPDATARALLAHWRRAGRP